MNLADRRSMIRIAIGAALAPVLATRQAHAHAVIDGVHPIVPPGKGMTYRRILQRGLPDGVTLTVERSFAVHFEGIGRGFRLSGNQVSAAVQAPDKLATFARLEERRVDRGVFPLLLDDSGLIVGTPGIIRAEEVTEALERTDALLGLEQGATTNGNEVARLVESLHRSTTQAVSYLPTDLFAPREQRRVDEREIGLPWGDTGSVRVEFEGRRDGSTGLMREASRTVITSLMGDRRESVERRSLT